VGIRAAPAEGQVLGEGLCLPEWGLTLIAMAKLLGVVQSTLCRWESGEREPTGAYLARAEALLNEAADSESPGK
jgi:hypothetical protein